MPAVLLDAHTGRAHLLRELRDSHLISAFGNLALLELRPKPLHLIGVSAKLPLRSFPQAIKAALLRIEELRLVAELLHDRRALIHRR